MSDQPDLNLDNNEAQLIAAAQADRNEFVKLYDLHVDAILAFLVSRCGDRDLAEDITSDTFMIALEKINTFVYTGAPFRSWLYRIAINELNKHYRKNKKEWKLLKRSHTLEAVTVEAADFDLKEDEAARDTALNLGHLNEAFNRLKENERTLLSLRFFDDKSYKEIGEILGISTNNVGVRINRALKRLKRICPLDLLNEQDA